MLRVDGISVRFGGVLALDEVTFEVPPGSVTGLIGPNGAGKTTLFNVISGLQRPTLGVVRLDSKDITDLSPTRRARLGLARSFQRLEVFGTLTARDNILVAAELHATHGHGGAEPLVRTRQLLDRLHLTAVSEVQADTLPTGLARLVELGRALATEPSILLLDEPSSGLNTAETIALGDLLRELAQGGLAVLLVEHDMELVMRICEQVSVMDFGRLIASGPPSAIQVDPAVQLAYLGVETHGRDQHRAPPGALVRPVTVKSSGNRAQARNERPAGEQSHASAPAALELRGINAAYGAIEVLHGVDLTVPAATVFALLGPNGAGKSSTMLVASGRLQPTSGTVQIDGREVTGQRPERLARSGVCSVPEGRGVFPNLTVSENLQMWTFQARRPRGEIEERAFGRFPILRERRRQLAGTLSGGEQQMLAISRAFSTDPRLLLLDELSAGLAPIVVAQLYEIVGQLAGEGIAILVVEQSVRAALSVADRAAVMANGRVVAEGTPGDIEDSVRHLYLGTADVATLGGE